MLLITVTIGHPQLLGPGELQYYELLMFMKQSHGLTEKLTDLLCEKDQRPHHQAPTEKANLACTSVQKKINR